MDQCMQEKLGMARPPYGYFTQLRVHHTDRPKPKSFATEFKNANKGLSKDFDENVKEKLGEKHPLYAEI